MFTLQEITDKLNWLNTVKEQTQKEFKSYLADKRISLEDRWKVFQRQGSKHLDTTESFDFFGIHLEDIADLDSNSRNSFFYYDDLLDSIQYLLKSKSITNIVLTTIQKELISKHINLNNKDSFELSEYNEIVTKTINSYKEEILKTGYYGFKYDW